MTLLLAQMPPWVSAALVVFFLFICVLLILTVLIQRPAGGGLSGAFGSGAGSGQTAFGAKTGDALTIATIAMFVVYILFAIGLNYATRPGGTGTITPVVGPATSSPTETAPSVPPQPAELGPIPGSSQSGPNNQGTQPTPPPSEQPATPPGTPPAGEQPASQPQSPPQEPSAQPPAPQAPPPAEPQPTNPPAPGEPQPAPGR